VTVAWVQCFFLGGSWQVLSVFTHACVFSGCLHTTKHTQQVVNHILCAFVTKHPDAVSQKRFNCTDYNPPS